jgi:hypothetical protein
MYCPYCGNEIREEKAVYCPHCGKPLGETQVRDTSHKKTGFPIAGGILTILDSCMCAFIGGIGLLALASEYMRGMPFYYYTGYEVSMFVIAFFGIMGFAFGLASGIMSLRRRHFALSIAGLSLLILTGIAIIIGAGASPYEDSLSGGLEFGLPIMGIAILSLIFVAISKQEFS